MQILVAQRRQLSHAYAALVSVCWQDTVYTLVLQHHPAGPHRWQSGLYDTLDALQADQPGWRSETYDDATDAIDALLERLAPLGLPDDLTPLVLALLPDRPIGQPIYDPA